MAQLMGLARIGRDVQTRTTPNGDTVANLPLAFSWGRKDGNGNRQTLWVDGVLWGQRAETLAPYLLKGTSVYVGIDDAHMETFQKSDGTEATRLTGKVSILEFAGKPPDRQPAPAKPQRVPSHAPPQRPATQQVTHGSLADMSDDIPF